MDIVCLGELLVDMFPAEIGRRLVDVSAFCPKPGGAPANVAVAAVRLGAQCAFVGKVGDEAFGHYLVEVLSNEGVDTRAVRFDSEARTGMAFIAMPDENTAEILFYRNPGADMRLRADELDAELLAEARAFHFGSLSLIQEPSRSATMEAVRMATDAGAMVSFDVNYRSDLWGPDEAYETVMATMPHVNLVKVNETELAILTGTDDPDAGSETLLGLGPDVCVVTLGPAGSFFRASSGTGYVPAFEVDTVDATGCGDAFVAGILCRLVVGADWHEQLSPARLREILRYGNAVGGLTALVQGVIPALPRAERVAEFLAQYGQ